MSLASKLAGSRASDFSLNDMEGQVLSLSQQQGSPVVLVFFTDNCVWCRTELPRLGEIHRHIKPDQVHVIGILSYGTDPVEAARFAKEYELDFPVLLDVDGAVTRAYDIARVPTVVVVDEGGVVARVYEGATEQLPGIVEQTIVAAAGRHELPDYSLVGNGCAPQS